ncbi:Pentapeptide repeat-containing protein [Mesonia phycicola]|uniref:Pentapeptide repeat-containing protein n=1 Tax=Mesonia phycicola TaxID=579105 RepID=A0A1M6DTC2_9FLAO|nr:pentapeptide repeat-containing protein [Mesonia phycicola]SHI76380.1 Pentapeptide repeat-containing protein [Mesonia phycicola]
MKFYQDENFENIDFTTRHELAEFDNCSFSNCNFGKMNLTGYNFLECDFTTCDLSLATLTDTSFNQAIFKDCKLLGLRFDACNDFLFAVNFINCQLNFSSFFQRKMKNTNFKDCKLISVDFTEANLENSNFENTTLTDAIFDRTNLSKCNFTTAQNFHIHPEQNQIKAAHFAKDNLSGLLLSYGLKIS